MNGFLVKPVDAALLYETLARLVTGGAAGSPQPTAPALARVPQRPAVPDDGLLNVSRLESYRRLGMLEELLDDYVPEMARLVRELESAAASADRDRCLDALHSLLGMSGEAGAHALYQEVRRVYVPLLEQEQWPTAPDWVEHLQGLASRTEEALAIYCAAETPSGA
jgi:HPt (histidine-containing phosphotransfer) domain-containing protein